MPTELGTNYPNILGRFNFPTQLVRLSSNPAIGSAMARGEMPVHLAQRFNGSRIKQVLSGRKMPILDAIRARGQAVRGQAMRVDGLGRNIPQPYVRTTWSPYANIGQVPSVISDINGASGPERTIHPQRQHFSIMI